jgi:hypothetical protein
MLAAYIDGEGCICIGLSPVRGKPNWTPHYSLTVSVSNSDPRLPIWCRQIFGGYITNKEKKTIRATSKRALFQWMCCSETAEWILRGCMPYFKIKREQAEIGLAFRETFPERKYGKGKDKKNGVPPDVLELRQLLKSQLSTMKEEISSEAYAQLDKEMARA